MNYLLRLKTKRHGWAYVGYAEEDGMTGLMVLRFTHDRDRARAMSHDTADWIASTQNRAAKIVPQYEAR